MSDIVDAIEGPFEVQNAKARRAAARKARAEAVKKREELFATMLIKPAPPAERVSFFGNKYENATELKWHYFGFGYHNEDVTKEREVWIYNTELYHFNRNYAKCKFTGKVFPRGYLKGIHGEEGYAFSSALPTGWRLCDHSGYVCKVEDLVEVHTSRTGKALVHKDYLNSDYVKCDVSGRWYSTSCLLGVKGHPEIKRINKWLIDNTKYLRCSRCGKVEINDGKMAITIAHRSDSGDYECASCYEQRTIGQVIKAHNWAEYPKPIFTRGSNYVMLGGEEYPDPQGGTFWMGKRVAKNVNHEAERLFGVEAETEICRRSAEKAGMNRSRLAMNAINSLGEDFIIVKEDGTLTANKHYSERTGYAGFEIVTCPADLAEHRKRWPRLHEMPGFKCLRAWDEYDTCGFHVHVSRNVLTHAQIGRILMFINHPDNAKFIFKVAGRGSDRFCKYIPKEPGDKTHPITDVLHVDTRVISKEEENSRNRSRRVAVNLCNKNTIEFRIFRGTIHPRHILRNIEFCDAVCDFCYPGNFSMQDMANYKAFIGFVNCNRKRWPLLAEWLANQKFIALRISAKANMEKLTINPDNAVEAEIAEKKAIAPESPPEIVAQYAPPPLSISWNEMPVDAPTWKPKKKQPSSVGKHFSYAVEPSWAALEARFSAVDKYSATASPTPAAPPPAQKTAEPDDTL